MNPSAERCLWLSVLLAGLLDAAKKGEVGWLHSKDFTIVCHMAEVNPEMVRIVFQTERDRIAKMGRI